MITDEQLQCLKVLTEKVSVLEKTYNARDKNKVGGYAPNLYIHQELCNARVELRYLTNTIYNDNNP